MKSFTASIDIHATPDVIWDILTDGKAYTEWDEQMISLDGTIAPNQKLTVLTHLAPDRAFTPTVSEFEVNRRMVWSSKMPLGLFSGVRTFELTPKGDVTGFRLTEEFSGLLLPIFGATIPDMNPVFDSFVKALKARAEAR